MNDGLLLLHTAVAIAVVIVLVVWVRLSPVIALVVGSMYLGAAAGLGLATTVETIGQGFGELMGEIGLPIGFGVMLGSLLAAAGGIRKIAEAALRLVSRERSPYALGATGLVISTPVFYDVAYVILAPLAQSIAVRTGVSIAALGAALALGLGAANLFIPPTPGPLAVAGILEVPLGTMILFGGIVAIPSAALALFVYIWLLSRGLWDEEKDEEEFKEIRERGAEESEGAGRELPSLGVSLFPIFLPLALILLGTAAEAAGLELGVLAFLGDRITALLLGLLAAYSLARRMLSRERFDEAVSEGLRASGLILLITGAGGALGAVLAEAGTGDVIAERLSAAAFTPILLVWVVGALLRVAQGSGTVAIITAASIAASAVGGLEVSPVLLALAAFSGALFGGHVNDSGFWVSAKLLGLSTSGGFKIYTLPQSIASVISLGLILVLSLVL